jgi:hypothetical protein
MSLVSRRWVAFSLENMSQMTTAVCTNDLCSLHAKRAIGVAGHGAGDVVKICWPSATRFELLICFVKGRVAGCACIDSFLWHVLVVFACEGSFGALLSDNSELFCGLLDGFIEGGGI